MNLAAHHEAGRLPGGENEITKMRFYQLVQGVLRMNGAGEIPSRHRH